MLIQFRHSLRSIRAYRVCLQCVFVLVLVLVAPFSFDGLDHDQYSIEASQTHFATSDDMASMSSENSEQSDLQAAPQQHNESHRLPTRRFLITTTSASFF